MESKFRFPLFTFLGLLVRSKEEQNEIRKVHEFRKKLSCYYVSGRAFLTFKKTSKILDKVIDWEHVDSCLFYSYWFNYQALTAGKLKKIYSDKTKTLSISRAHGFDVYDDRNSLNFIPYRTVTTHDLDSVYVCSMDGMHYLQSKVPFLKNKIKVSYLGTKDYGTSQVHTSLKQEFHLVTCSNLVALKRVDLVCESVKLLVDSSREVHWTCIGDGPEMGRLKEMVQENNIEKYVTFFGSLPNTDVLNFYKSTPVDLFVNVSESEGLPVSIMEALSFGIPCIATDVGGTSDILSDKEGRLLSADLNATLLADEIEKIIELSEISYKQLRVNARKTWEEQYSAKHTYKQWYEELREMMENNN